MATPSGTITLAANEVLFQSASPVIIPADKAAVGIVRAVATGVTAWAANDIIFFDNTQSYSFTENSVKFSVINQQYIFFKYAAAP